MVCAWCLQLNQWLLRANFGKESLNDLENLLFRSGVFDVNVLPTGLFRASEPLKQHYNTGMQNTWVRDVVYCAEAMLTFAAGQNTERAKQLHTKAVNAIKALMRFFDKKETPRFEAIASKKVSTSALHLRPHIRFNGETGEELAETWSHAQNDALGNFLRVYCMLCQSGDIRPNQRDFSVLANFVHHFVICDYTRDRDSGHWEEEPKIEASSIAPAMAGIKAVLSLTKRFNIRLTTTDGVDISAIEMQCLITLGQNALAQILPWESRDPALPRETDAALLFAIVNEIIDPNSTTATTILANVRKHLQGDHGIKRYLNDTYWGRDYRSRQPSRLRENSGQGPNQEAEWTLFDPIMSEIYGQRYLSAGLKRDQKLQQSHFVRSLQWLCEMPQSPGQLKMPEMFVQQTSSVTGKVVHMFNDNGPLLWSAMNLLRALRMMHITAS